MKCSVSWKASGLDRQDGEFKFHIAVQLFAEEGGEKTEKATPKKRQEARKKGQVLQSREINSTVVMLMVFLSLKLFGGFVYREISSFTGNLLSDYFGQEGLFTLNGLMHLFMETILLIAKVMVPVFGAAFLSAMVASYAQVGFTFTTDTLMFKLERINPLNGAKRIFSLRSVAELVKALFKISASAGIAYSYMNRESLNVIRTMGMDVASSASYIIKITIDAGLRISIVLLAISFMDYLYQWWQFEKDLRMTKREVKEEYKQTEGNPETRQRIRQKQRQVSLTRMLTEVPKADVVITNPTHYAVAVRYDADMNDAPVVVGKGLDYMASRIKELARKNNIAIVENKPLAKSLYEMVDVGDAIPEELYQAVAEILAYVYTLSGKKV